MQRVKLKSPYGLPALLAATAWLTVPALAATSDTPAPETVGAETTRLRTVEEIASRNDQSTQLADAREREAQNVQPLSLVDAIVLTLKNNPQREAALAALQAAEARIGTARSSGKIQASVSGSATYSKYYGGGGNMAVSTSTGSHSESLGIDASLPVYDGGRTKSSTRSAQASARAQAASTLQVEQQLVESTITAYLDVLRNGQLLEVAENNLDVSRERQRVAAERYRVGAGARLDVLSANTSLANARQTRIEAGNAYVQSKSTLNILLGREPETPIRLEPVTALNPRVPLSTGTTAGAELRTLAEQNNPALAQNRAQIEAANADVDTAKAARKPSFSLSLSNLLTNPVQSLGRFLLSIGLSASQTLIDSGKSKSQISEAQALVTQARANLNTQLLSVAGDIDTQLLTLESAQERLTTANEAVLEAQEALTAAQAGYAAGARTSLEVADAQASLLSTQTDAANARFDVANAQAQLATAVGVLTTEGQQAYTQALADLETQEKAPSTKTTAKAQESRR